MNSKEEEKKENWYSFYVLCFITICLSFFKNWLRWPLISFGFPFQLHGEFSIRETVVTFFFSKFFLQFFWQNWLKGLIFLFLCLLVSVSLTIINNFCKLIILLGNSLFFYLPCFLKGFSKVDKKKPNSLFTKFMFKNMLYYFVNYYSVSCIQIALCLTIQLHAN